jgi:hypothetical protein
MLHALLLRRPAQWSSNQIAPYRAGRNRHLSFRFPILPTLSAGGQAKGMTLIGDAHVRSAAPAL